MFVWLYRPARLAALYGSIRDRDGGRDKSDLKKDMQYCICGKQRCGESAK